jgi:hypothetical protein
MPKPQQPFNAPDFTGQSKILIVSQDNPLAMLMTHLNGHRNVGGMHIKNAQMALDWCLKNQVMMVFMPLNPTRN